METFADAPWLAPCTCACGCGRPHMHTIFRVIDGAPKWFLSVEHLDTFNRAGGGTRASRSCVDVRCNVSYSDWTRLRD
jgi:hypothetical protein